jgi:hypothetical protein
MGRTFVVLAALAAFMLSMSACKCPPASSSSGGGGGSSGATSGGTVCVEHPDVAVEDCTASYRSEADRNMANLIDCGPHGGHCSCNHKTLTCEERMPGTHRE